MIGQLSFDTIDQPVDTPPTGRVPVTMWIDPHLARLLKEQAQVRGLSVSALAYSVLSAAVDRGPVPQRTVTATAPVEPPAAGTLRWRVLEALEAVGHATARELVESHGVPCETNVAARRLSDLVAAGLVADSGAARPGRAGRRSTVWQITDAGRATLKGSNT